MPIYWFLSFLNYIVYSLTITNILNILGRIDDEFFNHAGSLKSNDHTKKNNESR